MIDDLYTTDDDGNVTLAVHASPGAGRSSIVGRHGQAVKVRVAAPPEGGRANAALAALLAEEFGVAESAVELVAGPGSRSKRFKLSGVDPDDFRRALERVVGGGNAGPGPGVRGRDTR
jgi:uncharacterized protein (TIGR00251 family)